jgi:glycosyltransferase involved in cell wall biosynthesis
MLEILQKEKPQIVKVGSPYFIPSRVNKNKEFLNYKTVGFFHSNIEGSITSIIKRFNKPFTAAAKSFIKKEYKDFDLIISPSKFIEKYLKNLDMKNTVTVHLGIDTDIFSYKKKDDLIRKKYNLPQNKIILVYAGRLSSDKNVLNIAEVYNILSYFRPEKYHLLLIGSGHLEEKLLKKIKGSFTYLGYVRNKIEYCKLLSSCDIFITPSKIETFGLAIVEAQACGLPVVAYKEGAIPEVVYKKELLAESIETNYKFYRK